LPYGNGRSYGDVCLNNGGGLWLTRALDRFIEWDPVSGILRCEAGVTLEEVLAFVVPRGWFLSVTPGTQFVTVGGAIANDVHGKNHHVAGSFGCTVRALELLRSDGTRLECSRETNKDWFAATVGGLGLTGLITWADVQLKRIASPMIVVRNCRFARLDDYFRIRDEIDAENEFSVAWVDCLASGQSLGRGILMGGNHAAGIGALSEVAPDQRRSFPFDPPMPLINNVSLRFFNTLYYRRPLPDRSTQHYGSYFYPLDALLHWNRLYGRKGFVQYQCVVPPDNASDSMKEILERIARSGEGSFLAVLKTFGNRHSPGMMSFPRPGVTIAVDFPWRSEKTLTLLEALDEVTESAGGRVYPAKDARMSGERFRRYYPAWQAFSNFIDPRCSSSFWRRVME
jgi:FAD/FMN-containing dehydrogenase